MEKSLFNNGNSKSSTHKEITPSSERENTKLTLRKNHNMQKYLSHLLQNCDDTYEYELSEKDFENSNMIIDGSNNCILHSHNNTSFALWLFNVRKALSERSSSTNTVSSYSVIKSLTPEQVNTLVDILLTYPLDSKLKYESCWVLINIVAETNTFNEYFLLRIKEVYDNLFLLINHDSPNAMCFILIRHIQWFLSNLIHEKEICDVIREEVNIPRLIQAVFAYITLHYKKDSSPLYSQISLMIEINMQMLDFFLLNSDPKLYFQFKSFLTNIAVYIKQAYSNNNDSLLKECLDPLYNYTLSQDCIELIVSDTELIEVLIKAFDSYETGQLILLNIIKNSKDAVQLVKNHDVIDRVVLLILKCSQNLTKTSYSNGVITNTLKLLNAIISYDSFNCLIERMVNDTVFLGLIPKIFSYYDIEVKQQIFIMHKKFFLKGEESIKSILIKVKIHLFTMQELKSLLDSPKSSNELYHKAIAVILQLLGHFISFGQKDKINYIQKELEDENVIEILLKLQYHQNEAIYEKANELLVQYWNEDDYDLNDNNE